MPRRKQTARQKAALKGWETRRAHNMEAAFVQRFEPNVKAMERKAAVEPERALRGLIPHTNPPSTTHETKRIEHALSVDAPPPVITYEVQRRWVSLRPALARIMRWLSL